MAATGNVVCNVSVGKNAYRETGQTDYGPQQLLHSLELILRFEIWHEGGKRELRATRRATRYKIGITWQRFPQVRCVSVIDIGLPDSPLITTQS